MSATISNSTSDDEQHQSQNQQQPNDADDRKQKRMLSNRESARRSRQRKQQHLEELRAQLANLRAEHCLLMDRFTIASQQYTRLTDENRLLRSSALELGYQLDRLRQIVVAHQQAGGEILSIEPSVLDLLAVTSSYSTCYPPQQHS